MEFIKKAFKWVGITITAVLFLVSLAVIVVGPIITIILAIYFGWAGLLWGLGIFGVAALVMFITGAIYNKVAQ